MILVKRKIAQVVPPVDESQMRLIWQGRELSDKERVSEAGIVDGDSVHLVVRAGQATSRGPNLAQPPPSPLLVGGGAVQPRIAPTLTGVRRIESINGVIFTVLFTLAFVLNLMIPAGTYMGSNALTSAERTKSPSFPIMWCNSTCKDLPMYNGPSIRECNTVGSGASTMVFVGMLFHLVFLSTLAATSWLPALRTRVQQDQSCFCGVFCMGFVAELFLCFGCGFVYMLGDPSRWPQSCIALFQTQEWAHYQMYTRWALSCLVILCLTWLSFWVPRTDAFLHGALLFPANGFPMGGANGGDILF